jgi:hypothetical protein
MKLLSLALLALLALPQDKVTFKLNPNKGDKLSKTEKTEMAIKAKLVAGEQEQPLEFEQRGLERTTTEILEVADGAVVKALLTCHEDVEEKKGPPAQQWEKQEKPLHGRKITLSLKDGKLVREGVDGLEAKIVKKLTLSDRTSHIFPKTPVAPGDAWEVQGDDVREFLGADDDLKEGKIKIKLEAVKDIEGKKCAVMQATIEVNGKAEGDINLTIKLDAEVIVWLDRGYPLSVKGKGTIAMKGENAQFKLSGQGPMSLDIVTKVE